MYFYFIYNSVYFVYLNIFGSLVLNQAESKTFFELLVKIFHKLLDWCESLMLNSALRSAGTTKKCGQNWQQSRLAIKPLIHERNSMCSNRIWVFTGLFKWKSYEVTLKDLPEWSQLCRKREEEEAIPFPVILGNMKLEVLLVGVLTFCQRGASL